MIHIIKLEEDGSLKPFTCLRNTRQPHNNAVVKAILTARVVKIDIPPEFEKHELLYCDYEVQLFLLHLFQVLLAV